MVRNLATLMENFPLAIQQAGAYIKHARRIKNEKYSIHNYMAEFQIRKMEMLQQPLSPLDSEGYQLTSFTAIRMTVSKIVDNADGQGENWKFVRYTVGEGGRIVVNKMRSSPRHYVARHDPNEIFTEQSEDAMDTMKNLQRCLNMMLGVVSEIGEDSADHSAIQIAGAVVRLSAISLLHVA
ncbi:hypothetical protein Fcan01_27851, partial [Folsomia candida]